MTSNPNPSSTTQWNYPQRQCRVCMGEVDPTIRLKNSNLLPTTENVVVSYTSPEEGRLLRPCKCKGSARYVHEKCLAALRGASHQRWTVKCNECQYYYNTHHPQKYLYALLRSKGLRLFVTIWVLIILMFILGFIADPVINIYVDPVETMATRDFFRPLNVNSIGETDSQFSWFQHFLKGFVSMGVLGFIKTAIFANPLHYWNLRQTGMVGGGVRRGTTGRDRVANISWMAVLIGISTALYWGYEWLSRMVKARLDQVAEILVETSLDRDDEDLKPPFKGIVDLSAGTVRVEHKSNPGSLGKSYFGSRQGEEQVTKAEDPVAAIPVEDNIFDEQIEKPGYGKGDHVVENESDKSIHAIDPVVPSVIHQAQRQTWSFDNF